MNPGDAQWTRRRVRIVPHFSVAPPSPSRRSLVVAMAIASSAPQALAGVKPPVVKLDYEKYTLPNGLEVILREDHRLPMVAVNTWYHVGTRQRDRRQDRLRPPLRAHDVPVVGTRGRGPVLEVHGRRGRLVHQRHDRFRPHQLHGGRSLQPARDGALARERSDGIPPRPDQRHVAGQPAGRGAQRAPAERGERALPARRGGDVAQPLPEGPPVLRGGDRIARGHPVGQAGRREGDSSGSTTARTTRAS